MIKFASEESIITLSGSPGDWVILRSMIADCRNDHLEDMGEIEKRVSVKFMAVVDSLERTK